MAVVQSHLAPDLALGRQVDDIIGQGVEEAPVILGYVIAVPAFPTISYRYT